LPQNALEPPDVWPRSCPRTLSLSGNSDARGGPSGAPGRPSTNRSPADRSIASALSTLFTAVSISRGRLFAVAWFLGT